MMNKEIQKGDRIFARLTMGGKPVVEFMINTVASMEQLLGELRHMTANLRGLGRLQVRNQSRGWMSVSNLMFYGEAVQNGGINLFNPQPATARTVANTFTPATSKRVNTASSRMAFPWDTH